jgi:hypothetical protein
MSLTSPNGQFQLVMQSGGDLVETTTSGTVIWRSGTSSAGAFVIMQTDGNLVIYSASGVALWASNTVGNLEAYLRLGNVGQLSVDSGSGVPLWEPGNVASNTTVASGSSAALPGMQVKLTMQTDGNLVESNTAGVALWASNTSSTGARAVMQSDGNLVVYSTTNAVLWASNTNGNPGAFLSISDIEQLAIVSTSGRLLWEPGSLLSGTVLKPGALTTLPGGSFKLTMQTDGNLVESNASGKPVWASGTSSPGAFAEMQGDGNLVVYSTALHALWASNTFGNAGADLALNDLGQLVINSVAGVPLWGPGLIVGSAAGVLHVNAALQSGQSVMSLVLPIGEQFQLTMQAGGNLVEETPGGSPLWSSSTNSPGAYVAMQGDGNLVVYSTTNAPLWASKTSGNPGAFLHIANAGQLAIESVTGASLFSSGPAVGPPPPPSLVSAVAGNGVVPDGAATISWTAPPPSLGPGPVWGFRITARPGGASTFVNAPAASATLSGLTDGTSYTFVVATVSSGGTGQASWPVSNPVTPRPSPIAPGPPAGVEAIPGNGLAAVSWSPPVDTGGSPITGYVATATPGGRQATAGPTATSVLLGGLTNGATYTITVAATSIKGTGTASAPSAPTVPATTPFPTGSTVAADTNVNDWPMYNYTQWGSDWNGAETTISSSHASTLNLGASTNVAGPIQSSRPIVAFGHVFTGSNTGYESAFNAGTFAHQWSTFLGTDQPATCPNSVPYGVVSAPTSATVNGTIDVEYLSGGDDALYALNASTGGILWRTELAPPPNNFSFVSPLLYNGALYTAVSSYGDCPLVQGKFFKIDPLTGSIEATFDMAPIGCTGGGLWGSPSVDATGHIFFATGTEVQGCTGTAEGVTGWGLETSVDEVDANLNLVGHWHLPEVDQVGDSDFGSVPAIYDSPGVGSGHLLAIGNKNGHVYVLDRQNLAAGPIWQDVIAQGGPNPSVAGSISPMSYDGTRLYVTGAQTTIAGKACGASLRALNPATGAVEWADCFAKGPSIGPVAGANGVVVVGVSNSIVVVNAVTGSQLSSYTFSGGANTFSGAAISSGSIFAQNGAGDVVRVTTS